MITWGSHTILHGYLDSTRDIGGEDGRVELGLVTRIVALEFFLRFGGFKKWVCINI